MISIPKDKQAFTASLHQYLKCMHMQVMIKPQKKQFYPNVLCVQLIGITYNFLITMKSMVTLLSVGLKGFVFALYQLQPHHLLHDIRVWHP